MVFMLLLFSLDNGGYPLINQEGHRHAEHCLDKGKGHIELTTTGGVGELSNFLLGAAFVLPAGLSFWC